ALATLEPDPTLPLLPPLDLCWVGVKGLARELPHLVEIAFFERPLLGSHRARMLHRFAIDAPWSSAIRSAGQGRETREHDRRRVACERLDGVGAQHGRRQLLVHHQDGEAVNRRPEHEPLLRRIAGAYPARALTVADARHEDVPRRACVPE